MSHELDDLFEKDALDIGKAAPVAAVGALVRSALPKKDTAQEIEQKAIDDYFDPVHDAEMRKIKTQAMLNDFLSNDPVISTYDPDDVLAAYNQVAQMVPRAAVQPAVMRGQLRKLLQQQDAMEPFEANQLVEVEKGLKKVQEPDQLPIAKAAPSVRAE